MSSLQQLCLKVPLLASAGPQDHQISSLTMDSRQVKPGTLFFAIEGTQVDGHRFIDSAIADGAVAVVCSKWPADLKEGIAYLQVADVSTAMGLIAANFYGNPSTKMSVIGVTGTNGKTSVVSMLFQLFRSLGHRCGLLSTVQNQIETTIYPSTHTTPDAISIQALMATMVKQGVSHCFMEVSSHAVVQQRIAGIRFAGGIFSNITHDHLDFHKTFDEYIKAKKGFFDGLGKDAFALVNIDDKRGYVMLQNTKAQPASYSLQLPTATYKGKIISNAITGLQMYIDQAEVYFRLIGRFNAYNLLAVYGAAILLDQDPAEVLTALSIISPPPGRFELVYGLDGRIGIVDYAHTPDALKNVLETINDLKEGNQNLITVVGCGGNRDATKRPIMAEIAANLSQTLILTSDNPRLEDPATILEQMQAGVPPLHFKKTKVISDRHQAILEAVKIATKHDIILVAGKGHETYQDIAGTKHHFDDVEELKTAFSLLKT